MPSAVAKSMSHYCYNCNRITAGEPLFCNFCGRSYNVKLCPRLHPNPRNAQICSLCGSRDLSIPQPSVPLWARIVEFVLRVIPGLALTAVSVLTTALFIVAIFTRPGLLVPIIFLLIALGFLWWAWSQIPTSFRHALQRLLMHRRKRTQAGRTR